MACNEMKGQKIILAKQLRMAIGVIWIVAGILVALFEAVLPIFELKGIFACFVGIPFIWIGVTKCHRAGNIRPADVMKLARELNGAITPQWVVATFDCTPAQAEKILGELRDANLIRLTQEGIDSGRMIFEVRLDDDPTAAAKSHLAAQEAERKKLADIEDQLLRSAGVSQSRRAEPEQQPKPRPRPRKKIGPDA
jgi:hypothetical protein